MSGLSRRMTALVGLGVVMVSCTSTEIAPPPLPTLYGGEGDCADSEQEPLNAAAWADTADSVIIGTVAEVEAAAVSFVHEGEILEPGECKGTLLPSLRVTLEAVSTYAGSNLDGEEVVLTFGHEVLSLLWGHDWGVTVDVADDGSVLWLDDERGRIVPGQRLGIDMICDPDLAYCGNGFRPLFMLDEHDRVRFQEIAGECGSSLPEGLEGIRVEELENAIGGARAMATAEEIEERAARRRAYLNLDPVSRLSNYYGAGCLTEYVACDPHCGANEVCVDGECIASESLD